MSDEISRLLNGSFASLIDRGDLRRATQLVFAILRSLELQGEEIISKEDRTQVTSSLLLLSEAPNLKNRYITSFVWQNIETQTVPH